MLFGNLKSWALLSCLAVASAIPLAAESDSTATHAIQLARSDLDSSTHQLLPRRGPASTYLDYTTEHGTSKLVPKGCYVYYIYTINWSSKWFPAKDIRGKAKAIDENLVKALKTAGKGKLVGLTQIGGSYREIGTGNDKKKVLRLTIAFPNLKDKATADSIAKYLKRTLEDNTKETQVISGKPSGAPAASQDNTDDTGEDAPSAPVEEEQE